jgi:hypothetical protein
LSTSAIATASSSLIPLIIIISSSQTTTTIISTTYLLKRFTLVSPLLILSIPSCSGRNIALNNDMILIDCFDESDFCLWNPGTFQQKERVYQIIDWPSWISDSIYLCIVSCYLQEEIRRKGSVDRGSHELRYHEY